MEVKALMDFEPWLTKGKVYEVIQECAFVYLFKADDGNISYTLKNYFEKVEGDESMNVKCIKTNGDFIKDNYYNIGFNYSYENEGLNVFCTTNNLIWTFMKKSQFDEYFKEVSSDIDNKETIITYEITYIEDGHSYITGTHIKDIETARKFKHEYEKLNHIRNVKIVKITEIKEEVE